MHFSCLKQVLTTSQSSVKLAQPLNRFFIDVIKLFANPVLLFMLTVANQVHPLQKSLALAHFVLLFESTNHDVIFNVLRLVRPLNISSIVVTSFISVPEKSTEFKRLQP